MRRNPTNKTKVATPDIVKAVNKVRELMAIVDATRREIISYMDVASFLVNDEGEVLAQRVSTKTGNARLEIM